MDIKCLLVTPSRSVWPRTKKKPGVDTSPNPGPANFAISRYMFRFGIRQGGYIDHLHHPSFAIFL